MSTTRKQNIASNSNLEESAAKYENFNSLNQGSLRKGKHDKKIESKVLRKSSQYQKPNPADKYSSKDSPKLNVKTGGGKEGLKNRFRSYQSKSNSLDSEQYSDTDFKQYLQSIPSSKDNLKKVNLKKSLQS